MRPFNCSWIVLPTREEDWEEWSIHRRFKQAVSRAVEQAAGGGPRVIINRRNARRGFIVTPSGAVKPIGTRLIWEWFSGEPFPLEKKDR